MPKESAAGTTDSCAPEGITGQEDYHVKEDSFAEGNPNTFNNSEESAEDASWGGTCCAFVSRLIPAGSMQATIFSISSTCIGAGIVGVPSAFNSVGILMAAFYLLAVSAETAYSMHLLALVAERTGFRTFEEMMGGLVHPHGVYFVGVIRSVFCFGACVAYVVTIGDLVTPLLESVEGCPPFLLSYWGIRLLQIGLWAVFFFPLMLPREINSVRYISTAGVGFVLFFCVCIIIHSCTVGLHRDPRPSIALVKTGNDALSGLGIFIFSFTCQVNCVEIYFEMKLRTPRRFTIGSSIAMVFCGLLTFMTGLFGYMDFGSTIAPSVLRMFNPIEDPQFFISYIGVFIKIAASYALLGGATRSALYEMMQRPSLSATANGPPMKPSLSLHLLVSVSLSVMSLLAGLFIPNVKTVFNFAGGFCGGFLAFILPALYYLYSGNWSLRTVGLLNYVSTYLMLMAGCVAVVFGTASTIYDTI